MLLGFGEIIPQHALKDFTTTELKALVNSKDTIDATTLRVDEIQLCVLKKDKIENTVQ